MQSLSKQQNRQSHRNEILVDRRCPRYLIHSGVDLLNNVEKFCPIWVYRCLLCSGPIYASLEFLGSSITPILVEVFTTVPVAPWPGGALAPLLVMVAMTSSICVMNAFYAVIISAATSSSTELFFGYIPVTLGWRHWPFRRIYQSLWYLLSLSLSLLGTWFLLACPLLISSCEKPWSSLFPHSHSFKCSETCKFNSTKGLGKPATNWLLVWSSTAGLLRGVPDMVMVFQWPIPTLLCQFQNFRFWS